MSKQVQMSQKVLVALVGVLVVSLVAVGYLLGRQSQGPTAEQALASPTPVAMATPIPLVGQAERSLDSRLDALEGQVGALRQKPVVQLSSEPSEKDTPRKEPLNPDELKARKEYFQQLDSVLGSSALVSPQPFATRLLEQGMGGDESQMDRVLAKTMEAANLVGAIKPPSSCEEHKGLVTGQLLHAIALLEEVRTLTRAGDVAKLKALPLPGDKLLSETLQLQKLDRSLRSF